MLAARVASATFGTNLDFAHLTDEFSVQRWAECSLSVLPKYTEALAAVTLGGLPGLLPPEVGRLLGFDTKHRIVKDRVVLCPLTFLVLALFVSNHRFRHQRAFWKQQTMEAGTKPLS